MKPELKKLLVLNLPYLLFVYLFAKCGQTYRLSAGADASAKLLHLTSGISAAFASPLPSLHPFDLCVGVVGAVAVRLIVSVSYTHLKQSFKQNYTNNIELSIFNCGLERCAPGQTWGPGIRDHYLCLLYTSQHSKDEWPLFSTSRAKAAKSPAARAALWARVRAFSSK